MKKSIILDDLELVTVKKIHQWGPNSSAIPIPKPILDLFKLKNGNTLAISIDRKLKMIVLSRPKDLAHKKSDISFHLGVPKEEFEKLLKE